LVLTLPAMGLAGCPEIVGQGRAAVMTCWTARIWMVR
jgi:hypothetical protein